MLFPYRHLISNLNAWQKNFLHLKKTFLNLLKVLEQNSKQGTPPGNDCYKIRLAIASKGKGKSSGARIITNIVIEENTVFLLSIYDKSERQNLSDKELAELLKQVPE